MIHGWFYLNFVHWDECKLFYHSLYSIIKVFYCVSIALSGVRSFYIPTNLRNLSIESLVYIVRGARFIHVCIQWQKLSYYDMSYWFNYDYFEYTKFFIGIYYLIVWVYVYNGYQYCGKTVLLIVICSLLKRVDNSDLTLHYSKEF